MKKVFAKKALLASGWVDDVRLEVVDGQITAVTSAATADADDMSVGFVIPGLCNAHSHAFQRALAGHTEQRSPAGRDNFWTWRERMYDLAGRVDAEILSAIARQAYSEMLASGYTSVAEFHYLHHDPKNAAGVDTMFEAISAAASATGIRLSYVPVHYERAGFDDPRPLAHQQSFAQTLDEFLQHHERATAAASAQVNVALAFTVCAPSGRSPYGQSPKLRTTRLCRCICTLPSSNSKSNSVWRPMDNAP